MAKTKKKSKSSGLRSGLNFKNKYFLLIVLTVAGIGGFFAYKSFAATTYYNVTFRPTSSQCTLGGWFCQKLNYNITDWGQIPGIASLGYCKEQINIYPGETRYVYNANEYGNNFNPKTGLVYMHLGLGVFDKWNINPADSDVVTGGDTRQFKFPVNNGAAHVTLGTRRMYITLYDGKKGAVDVVKMVNQTTPFLKDYPVVVRANC